MNRLFLLLFVFAIRLMAQDYEFHIQNAAPGMAHISALSGEKLSLIDSLPSAPVMRYTFNPKKLHYGFYRLQFAPAKWLDFIYDDKPLVIKTDFFALLDSVTVISSESNRIFFDFIFLHRNYKIKSELLLLMLNRFPKQDEFYAQTQLRLRKLQEDYLSFIENIPPAQKKSFAARYIRSMQSLMIPDSITPEKQLPFLKMHSLDALDFNDVELTHSDVFTNKSIEYLTLFRNPQLPKELLEKEFMKAVDSLLLKARFNQFVYKHIAEYLIDGFKKFGFDTVLDYIVENYIIKDDVCLDSQTESMIHRRIEQAKVLAAGKIVPEMLLPDSAGRPVSLKSTLKDRNLVVFYATWCPHCKTLLPQLNELLSTPNTRLQTIYAVSLDTEREKWTNFIRENKFAFTNVSDLKGWEGPAVGDYFIYATPTMFLVDRNLKITGKPLTIDELKALL